MKNFFIVCIFSLLLGCGGVDVNSYSYTVIDCPQCDYSFTESNNFNQYPVYFNCDVPETGTCRKGTQHTIENPNFTRFNNAYKNDSLTAYFDSNKWKEFFTDDIINDDTKEKIVNGYYKLYVDPDSTIVIYHGNSFDKSNVLTVWEWNRQ